MKMKICLLGMFNNIINYNVKKQDKTLVKVILIDQLYKDLQFMLKCKTAEDCQTFVNECIDFYDLKQKIS